MWWVMINWTSNKCIRKLLTHYKLTEGDPVGQNCGENFTSWWVWISSRKRFTFCAILDLQRKLCPSINPSIKFRLSRGVQKNKFQKVFGSFRVPTEATKEIFVFFFKSYPQVRGCRSKPGYKSLACRFRTSVVWKPRSEIFRSTLSIFSLLGFLREKNFRVKVF